MDRARNSVDCGGPNRVSFDVGPGGLDALGRPSTDANAAPGRPGNDPGRGGEQATDVACTHCRPIDKTSAHLHWSAVPCSRASCSDVLHAGL